jgi:hypothetical protein
MRNRALHPRTPGCGSPLYVVRGCLLRADEIRGKMQSLFLRTIEGGVLLCRVQRMLNKTKLHEGISSMRILPLTFSKCDSSRKAGWAKAASGKVRHASN